MDKANTSLPHDHGDASRELYLEMPDSGTFEAVSELFKMMSDGRRVQIFWMLCHCEECAVNISALLGVTASAVSHHLKLLKDAGLIVSRSEGKEVYYTASRTDRVELLHEMIERTVETACPKEDAHMILNDGTDSSFTSTVSEIHSLLMKDLKMRYTIDELSVMYHINRTTLKTVFKRMFGSSIGAHMKHHRIAKAKELLCHSTSPISEIADSVGYVNQSKFTAAFRDVTGVNPKDYRRSHAKHRKEGNNDA